MTIEPDVTNPSRDSVVTEAWLNGHYYTRLISDVQLNGHYYTACVFMCVIAPLARTSMPISTH